MRTAMGAVLAALVLARCACVSCAADLESTAKEAQTAVAAANQIDVVHWKINTGDTYTIDPCHVELDVRDAYTASTRFWDEDGNLHKHGDHHVNDLSAAVTTGIVPNLDASLALGYEWIHSGHFGFDTMSPENGSGLDDAFLGMRWRFFKDPNNDFQVAYKSGFTIPTGTEGSATRIGTGNGFWNWDQSVVACKDWGRFTTNAQLGYLLPFGEDHEGLKGELFGNAACGYQVNRWLQPEIELNYGQLIVDDVDNPQILAATAGLIFSTSEHSALMAGVQQALAGRSANDLTAGVVTFRIVW